MNIKINKEHFERLSTGVIDSFIIGSKMYGTDTENSDTDILNIYNPNKVFTNYQKSTLGLPTSHQFQYDDIESNTQFMFITLEQFWSNFYSGESSINAEVVLYYMERYQHRLYSYKVIRGFLGFAKRDLHQPRNEKKLAHIKRSLYIANCLLNKGTPNKEEIKEIATIKSNRGSLLLKDDYNALKRIHLTYRDELKAMHDSNTIPMYITPKTTDDLLNILIDSTNIKEFTYKK